MQNKQIWWVLWVPSCFSRRIGQRTIENETVEIQDKANQREVIETPELN